MNESPAPEDASETSTSGVDYGPGGMHEHMRAEAKKDANNNGGANKAEESPEHRGPGSPPSSGDENGGPAPKEKLEKLGKLGVGGAADEQPEKRPTVVEDTDAPEENPHSPSTRDRSPQEDVGPTPGSVERMSPRSRGDQSEDQTEELPVAAHRRRRESQDCAVQAWSYLGRSRC